MRGCKILQELVFFPGCMIKYRLPFIEVSIRKVLEYFGIAITENPKFSCCPEPNGIKNSNSLTYSLTAARNLALAEKSDKHILTPCNGCFETLKGVRSEIRVNHHLRDNLNKYLKHVHLRALGISDVYHLIEYFAKFGSGTIKENVKYPLNSLRVAVHYGCHFLRPSNKIQMDDPLEPHIFDNLVEDLGARSIDYTHKMDCCGGSLNRAGYGEVALEIVQAKLESMKTSRIDCIVVGCPECFKQFDHLQEELKNLDYVYDIPVLYYSELLCLALGIEIRDIIEKYHRTPVESVFKKIALIHKRNIEIKKHFNLEFLKKCIICSACDNDCPVAKLTDFKPSRIIQNLLDGNINETISDSAIWMCLDCYLCYEFCPMRIGLVEVFTILRNLANKKNIVPVGFKNEINSFLQRGLTTMVSKTARNRVGLNTTRPELDDLKHLLYMVEKEEI